MAKKHRLCFFKAESWSSSDMDLRTKWPRSTDCVLTKPSLEKARMGLRKPSQMEDRQNDQEELCCDKAKS